MDRKEFSNQINKSSRNGLIRPMRAIELAEEYARSFAIEQLEKLKSPTSDRDFVHSDYGTMVSFREIDRAIDLINHTTLT